jgi:hypothetical protein
MDRSPPPPYVEAKQGTARTAQNRNSEPVRLAMRWTRRRGTAFMGNLRVRVGMLRNTSPDLVAERVIPGEEIPAEPGINGLVGESVGMRHQL